MKLQPNILIKQRNLKPVTTKGKYYYNNGKLGRLLKNIKRSSISERILICAVVSPDNSKGVFLDDKGHEYIITSKDLNSDLTYISKKFVKKKDKKFVGARYYSPKYISLVKNFLKRPDVQSKYKDWLKGDGMSPSVQINEEIDSMYEVGKCYVADDGDWAFKVLSEKDGVLQIQDLTDGKKYKVEVSDLELTHPEKMNESRGDGINPELKKITATLKRKCDNIYSSVGSIHDAAIYMKKYGRDYVQSGEPDRKMVDALIEDAKKTYNYYIVSVKGKLKDLDLDEYDQEYLDNMLSGIEQLRKIDMETIDLDDLKNMF